MGIIRDFTKTKIDELNEIVSYYELDGQWELFDWIGDVLASNLNVSDYLNEMEKFHELVIDKHNIYISDFQKIIDAVEAGFMENIHFDVEWKSEYEFVLYNTYVDEYYTIVIP